MEETRPVWRALAARIEVTDMSGARQPTCWCLLSLARIRSVPRRLLRFAAQIPSGRADPPRRFRAFPLCPSLFLEKYGVEHDWMQSQSSGPVKVHNLHIRHLFACNLRERRWKIETTASHKRPSWLSWLMVLGLIHLSRRGRSLRGRSSDPAPREREITPLSRGGRRREKR
jgi:hypothetical protein